MVDPEDRHVVPAELRQQAASVVVAIDDDTTFLLATAKALASAGMVCHTATTGEVGLQLIRDKAPDLVLLDILLIGESGFTICQEIRRTWSPEALPVIMVTGLDDLESIKAAYESGANDFLVKPLHWKHLPFRIWHILQASRDITERKRTEEALRISEEKFTKIFQMSPDAIDLVRTTDRVSLDFNRAFTNLFDYRPEDFIGKPGLPSERDLWVNKEDRDRLLTNLKEHGQVLGFEAPLRRKDGSSIIAEIACSTLEINGESYHLSITRDITEWKRTVCALQESEERYQRITEAITDYIYTVRVTDGYAAETAHGPGCLAITGYHANEFVNDPFLWVLMVVTDDRPRVEEQARRILAGEDPPPIEHRIIHKNGTVRWVRNTFVPHRDEHGTLVSYDGLIQDITERKQAEEERRKTAEDLRESQRIAKVGSWRLDLASNQVVWSDELYRMYGFDPTLPPPDYTEHQKLFTPESWNRLSRALANTVETGIPYEVELEMVRDGKGIGWMWAYGKTVLDANGMTVGLAGAAQDITERKDAEEEKAKLQAQLLQAQKMEGLGSLAGGLAHDMNNVLGAILGMASANIAAQPVGSPTYQAFDTISQAAIRGGKTVKSLLNFARQSPTEEHELDMNAILREEVHLLERTTLAKIRLEMDLASELRPILGDVSALTHAFMNLCVNAVDAMPESGTLTLRTRNVDNDWIEVLVEDTGTGMPKEVLEKAMDPFFTTKEVGKGTGLGLSMVYSTVKAHHGQIEIQSEPDQGTRVRMRFPAYEPMVQHSEPAVESQADPAQGKLNVLLVDDDELIQSSMHGILEVLGHSVTAALSGEEALARLGAGFEPDVVILDMNMPGLGGTGTLPRLRAMRPTVPVLLSTGRADEAAMNLIKTHPFVTLLSKPFTMKELKQQLESIGRVRRI